ncbi:hypothetical protein A3Q34_04965 [Colwellia sp. PAMC 20917]|uniref:Cas10/Cmr2 second palm domain-containing protein n=1 Tax=Colwellia sp. PAMC 20917 TaxID=1816218 RepID=UPI00087809D3|nr:hypothetical protein [Colwellia sp. PAMC 20917]AOW76266.1 hypothetical protein A3Q34_04965 [Colwellia sp. PAMC 20917]
MVYSYLFEAKSIQTYLFKTGKVKDIIATSERLDLLVDDKEESLLFKVIKAAKLTSDLLISKDEQLDNDINFIRCKGGAFYCYSTNKASLVKLRSLWTLAVQQMFPSLEFTDALISANTLQTAIQNGHKQLAADRNTPTVKFPIATSISERSSRTGSAATPMSKVVKYESIQDESGEYEKIDIDTDFHRQAYSNLAMKDGAALQDKFTPENLKTNKGAPRKVNYPVDLENDFQFIAKSAIKKSDKEAIKDIALIHIDGNGLGLLLRALQGALKNATDEQFCRAFRQFSEALAKATQHAAQQATQELYNVANYQLDGSSKVYLPMRPLVLGGDDVTLLCRADLALKYSSTFCKAFKESSQKELAQLYKEHLLNAEKIKPYLTASGGILYHKASHPFVNSHHLVEGLCAKAKKLTKDLDPNIGPAALAFFRLSNSVTGDIETLCRQSQVFNVKDVHGESLLSLGVNAYVVDQNASHQSLDNLFECIKLSNKEKTAVSMTKWRQMATELALGDKVEADRIYARAMSLCENKAGSEQVKQLQKLSGDNTDNTQWYWSVTNQESPYLQSAISDMLIVDHFSIVNAEEHSNASTKETA